jgi:hypothetical protein
MKRATISDAPAFLNTNDKAFWVTGWNECAEGAEAAVKQARIDALVSAQQAAMALGNSCSLNAVRAAIESLKGTP